jgi:hypothetical protein
MGDDGCFSVGEGAVRICSPYCLELGFGLEEWHLMGKCHMTRSLEEVVHDDEPLVVGYWRGKYWFQQVL